MDYFKILDLKERRSIFHLILHNNTDSFKANLMLGNFVTEPIVKDSKMFNSCVEGFLSGSSSTLIMRKT